MSFSRPRHSPLYVTPDRSPCGINVPLAFRCTSVGVEQQRADPQRLYLPEVQRGLPEDVGPD